ncbi:MAG TPA: lipoprotein-releasing system transmembrane subunit LolC, partial [Bacteroidetes bacterium]|nr:lipoprotein-releasing system transmembrane subunit LolC [Bacteroidota bacterium]
MHYTWTIANRYLRSKRRTGFISLITYLSAAGVAVGAAALVIVLSIMNGFEDEVRSRILGADAYLRVSTFHERGAENWRPVADSIAAMEDVVAVTPYVLDKGMIRHRRRSEGCVVRGIDPATVGRVNELPNMLVAGSLDSLDAPEGSGALPGAILGRYLADELVASPGDTVLLFAPGGMLGPFAAPRVSRLRVAGIFESGLAEFDQDF